MKIFCRDCKHFSFSGRHEGGNCLQQNNRVDTFFEPGGETKISAKEKNANNDCGDFEKIESESQQKIA